MLVLAWPRALAVLTVLCTTVCGDDITREKLQITNNSEVLAKSLRRQLMKDNYDYMSTEGDEAQTHMQMKPNQSVETVIREENVINGRGQNDKVKKKKKNKHVTLKLKDSTSYSIVESSDKDLKRTVRGNLSRKLAKRRKKLHRYMYDIDEDMAKRYKSRYRYKIFEEDNSVTDQNIEQTTTVKYKVLKLKSPYRRSGQAAALIQEESPHGVSIVKLGIGPFPEFRLPRSRRQYMNVPQPLEAVGDDEEELAPPLVDDTTQDDEDTYTQLNTEIPNIAHVPKLYFNEGQDSLKITVTPDEILVL